MRFMRRFLRPLLLGFRIASVTITSAVILSGSDAHYKCPEGSQSPPREVPSDTIISIEKTQNAIGNLCILTRITEDGGSFAPVARSYDGFDWENVAGPYRSSLEITCLENDTFCTLQVPEVRSLDEGFYLISHEYSLNEADEAARFFEQSTFGTTRKDLQVMSESTSDGEDMLMYFSSWLHEQIYIIPPTLHRAHFRERATFMTDHATREGTTSHPCEEGARWRGAPFDKRDEGKYVTISSMNGRYALSVDGHVRTMVDRIKFRGGKQFDYSGLPASYEICDIFRNSLIRILYSGKCERIKVNEQVDIQDIQGSPFILDLNESLANFMPQAYNHDDNLIEFMIMKEKVSTLNPLLCAAFPRDGTPIFARLENGQTMIFDSRLVLQTNTLASPLDDGGGDIVDSTLSVAKCSNVPRTFLNDKSCRLSTSDHACSVTRVDETIKIELGRSSILDFYKLTGRYIYAVTGLDPADSSLDYPCSKGAKSRWVALLSDPLSCPTDVQETTSRAFQNLIKLSTDPNPFMKDIYFDDESCHMNDKNHRKIHVVVDGECWTNVHTNEYNVYDFTQWASDHPGGSEMISQFAEKASEFLLFPESHANRRWSNNADDFPFLARLGDSIGINDLPDHIRDGYIDEVSGIFSPLLSGTGTVICGSPGESGNASSQNLSFTINRLDDGEKYSRKEKRSFQQSRKDVWTRISLEATDQVRQRMAWTLSQILAVSPDASDYSASTEMFTSFYDIFVRNAFRNYKDVLREVSYSPIMAEMLTYIGSQSQEYIWNNRGDVRFADENYAREVMQLFSIGVVKLKMDGSSDIDDDGNEVLTYTNDDIEEYARAWTGFTRQHLRGNIEQQENSRNSIDPMMLMIETRDMFPKMGLDGQYVGDRYMLCSDLPKKAFLRGGATYRLLGKSKLPGLQKLALKDPRNSSDIHIPVLSDQSRLRSRLCNAIDGQCQYPPIVTIDTTISCEGIECKFDEIRVIQVSENVYYEYVRPPCVHSAFFSRGHLAARSEPEDTSVCADEAEAVASAACCLRGDDIAIHDSCQYTGELLTLSEATTRCTERGRELCAFSSIGDTSCGKCCNYNGLFWYNGYPSAGRGKCNQRVIIDVKGKVAIKRTNLKKKKHYKTLTFFRVHWENGYPSASNNGCDNNFCIKQGDYCDCKIKDSSKVAFTKAPTREDVLEKLHVGGLPPSLTDYAVTEEHKGVKTHFTTALGIYDENVVFEVTDRFHRQLFLRNVIKSVKLVSRQGQVSEEYTFRNPPAFISAVNPELRDAQYETEAVLDHYFYHQNTAPFLAYRFIQRFGHSNPSPRFVQAVADAFASGTYIVDGYTFGSNEYGDLAATVAAILLDRENRRVVLDKDPFHGSVREPLLKFIALMRSMEYAQTDESVMVGLYQAEDDLGQMAHELPSVFSFFLPDYAPPGTITESALVAPEASLLFKALGMMNGMLSLIKFGLTSCYEGLGNINIGCKLTEEGNYDKAIGRLSFAPNASYDNNEVVDELSTLLTSGRMSSTNRRLIRDAYEEVYSFNKDMAQALRVAQQLIIMSAEFHTNGLSSNTHIKKDRGVAFARKSCKKYKAVVHLFLEGGMDSYNLLVPHSGCSGEVSYDQYSMARGSVGLARNPLHQIDATTSSQPCDIFGIHSRMPFLKELYDERDMSFIAGIGVLSKPVTKKNFNRNTVTRLFSHSAMRHEIGRLDPFMVHKGTGTLGRLADVLSTEGYNVNMFSVDENFQTLEGRLQNNTKIAINSRKGFVRFNPADAGHDDFIGQQSERLNGEVIGYNNIFSDTWSSALYQARDADKHYWAQEYVNISSDFPDEQLGNRLESVARMIGSRECRGSDRDLFFVKFGGFDLHKGVVSRLAGRFDILNAALESFVEEIKAQDMWKQVTVVVSSDFGRTLSGNSASGTDHGWSGHSFIMSGAVDGGRIHGQYPRDLSDNSDLNIGRGRLIPELPWEAQWNPIAQWLGIKDEDDLNHALPNRDSFLPAMLLQEENVFLPDESSNINIFSPDGSNEDYCEGEGEPITCSNIPITVSPSTSPSPTVIHSQHPSIVQSETPSIQPTIFKESRTPGNPQNTNVQTSDVIASRQFNKTIFVTVILLTSTLIL